MVHNEATSGQASADTADTRAVFSAMTESFLTTLTCVADDKWEMPALGVWSVRELAGHASRALRTLASACATPAPQRDLVGATQYFVQAAQETNRENVAERGKQAGTSLGPDPVTEARRLAETALTAMENLPDDALVQTFAGGMCLSDYLETRVFELVLHTFDLQAALQIELSVPGEAERVVLHVLAELAAQDGKAVPVLRALTGRAALPDRFNLLGV